jgi:hypothetical protein
VKSFPQEAAVAAQASGRTSETQGESADLGKLNDDELVNTLREAQKAEKVVENAKKELVSEANRRGLRVL